MKISTALFLLLGAQLLVMAGRVGVAYDEPPYVAAGYLYWTQGLGFIIREHPPLGDYLRGLAVLAAGPELPRAPGRENLSVGPFEFGQHFLFRNRVPPKTILWAARLASVLMGLATALILWLWLGALAGETAAAAGLAFLAFEPNLLAHGSLATNDITVTLFMTLAAAAWSMYLARGGKRWPVLAGAATGAALASKATGLGLLPLLVLPSLVPGWRTPQERREDLNAVAVALAWAAGVILLVYGPTGLHFFRETMAYRFGLQTATAATYFFGTAYPEGHPLYFPGALLAKTTAPLLALALWGLFDPRARKTAPWAWRGAACALLLLLGASLASRRQLGIRNILPAYPLLCALAALGWAAIKTRRPAFHWALPALLLWHAGSSLANFPHHLAYFSELVAGPSRGRRILGDSNLDWGQALPELREFVRKNPGGVILSYFGMDCPPSYGLDLQEAFSTPQACTGSRRALPVELGAEWLAVGATKWQGFYEKGVPAFSWLHSRAPRAVLGNSLLVYDVSRDPDAHLELASMYERAGLPELAVREKARARWISSR